MIWTGDMGVSVGTAFATTGDVDASRNALDTLYSYQDPSGMLPYVGPPIAAEKAPGQEGGSDTYHLWAIIGTCDVAGYTLAAKAPAGWAAQRWAGLTKAVNASVAKITASDHKPIGGLNNCLQIFDRLLIFDFSNDLGG